MKVRDAIKLIKEDGWYYVNTQGDHRQFKHPTKHGRVTYYCWSSQQRNTLWYIVKYFKTSTDL